MAIDIQSFGANGITVHPRPDERHIKYEDVRNLKPVVEKEFNIEGYPNPKFLKLIKEIKNIDKDFLNECLRIADCLSFIKKLEKGIFYTNKQSNC